MRRISDCAVVRSSTDGHDAHVTYCDFADSNIACGNSSKDNGNFADSDIAHSDSSKDNGNFACRNFNGVGNKRGRCSDK